MTSFSSAKKLYLSGGRPINKQAAIGLGRGPDWTEEPPAPPVHHFPDWVYKKNKWSNNKLKKVVKEGCPVELVECAKKELEARKREREETGCHWFEVRKREREEIFA